MILSWTSCRRSLERIFIFDLLTCRLASNVAVSGITFAPSDGASGQLTLSLDTLTTLGVVFDVPRLHGVSQNDSAPWASLITMSSDIESLVDASNNTFMLVSCKVPCNL